MSGGLCSRFAVSLILTMIHTYHHMHTHTHTHIYIEACITQAKTEQSCQLLCSAILMPASKTDRLQYIQACTHTQAHAHTHACPTRHE